MNRKAAAAKAARPITARAIPTPRAALEPEDKPDEDEVPASKRGRLVADEDAELDVAPGEGDVVKVSEEEDDEDEEEEEEEEEEEDNDDVDVEDDEEDELVALAKFHPLICTPTTCVEPSTVLVSSHGPESVRV